MSKSTDTPNDKPKKKTASASKGRKPSKKKSIELAQTDIDPIESFAEAPTLNPTKEKVNQDDDEDGENSGDSFSENLLRESEYHMSDVKETSNDIDELNQNPRDIFEMESDEELLNRITGVYQIWWNWAHFDLSIISPFIARLDPSVTIYPEQLASDDVEFVYPICDYGNRLATSKGPEMYSAGMSMCKLYYTIEKMIFILIERLKSGGISTETEIQIAFEGHQLAQRKAFESVINLSYNVVVTNFDPGAWGERYLEIVRRIAEKGYGYPPEAPRDFYRNISRTSMSAKR